MGIFKISTLLSWILNGFLVVAVGFVTFAAQSEKARGLTSASYSPNSFRVLGGSGQNPMIPEATNPTNPTNLQPLGTSLPSLPPASLPQGTPLESLGLTLSEIQAVLGIYLSGLDGRVTSQELQNLYQGLSRDWEGKRLSAEEYLKKVAQEVQDGKGPELLDQALSTLSKMGSTAVVKITGWATDLMKEQGYTWDQIREVTTGWTQKYLGF